MRLSLVLGLLGLVSAANAATAATAQPAPVVTLPNNATITGTYETNAEGNNVRVFRGIPYAEPPVGELRWKQTTIKPVTGDINATQYGNICYNDNANPVAVQSEDCLFLNVFAPEGATRDSNLPVMVWIHGGQFIRGSSNDHDGANLVGAAGEKAVYVSLNYRLGVFGFLSNEEILAEGDGANFSLRDQEIAFHWVKQYIREFGGNPDDITAFGQSSGAMSVSLHHISRDGDQNLFHRSIAESGGYSTAHDSPSKSTQANYTAQLANAVGCSATQGASLLACLRKASAADVMKAVGLLPWCPTVDGVFLKDVPIRRVLEGKISHVPTIAGTNTDEGWSFSSSFNTFPTFEAWVRSAYPLLTDAEYERVNELYALDDFEDAHHQASQLFSDITFICPSELMSVQFAKHPSTPTYRYRYTELTNGVAAHAAELVYVFNKVAQVPKSAGSQVLVKAIQGYWIQFIKTANPNGSPDATVNWPVYTSAHHQIVLQQNITHEITGAQDPKHNGRCQFWYDVDQRIATTVSQ